MSEPKGNIMSINGPADAFPQLGASFRSLLAGGADAQDQVAQRIENLERTYALLPEALNARLPLALRAESLRRELAVRRWPRRTGTSVDATPTPSLSTTQHRQVGPRTTTST